MASGPPGPSREFRDGGDYFYPYAHLTDQRQMLMDKSRMDSYHRAILDNPGHFRGKAVLDCGSGTGILAIWAAKAGARVVYAVEATPVAKHTRTLVEANGVADIVTVIQGKIEEVQLPEKVDVIVSEWMGLLLLRDGMLDSVIAARDRWLAPGGSMFPSHCRLFLALTAYDPDTACPSQLQTSQQGSSVLDGWEELVEDISASYGVDYGCLTSALASEQATYHLQNTIETIIGGVAPGEEDMSDLDCEVEELSGDLDSDLDNDLDTFGEEGAEAQAMANQQPNRISRLASKWSAMTAAGLRSLPALIKQLDCHTVRAEELVRFSSSFALPQQPPGPAAADDRPELASTANSVSCWFDCLFNGSEDHPAESPVVLSTGPQAQPTHWGQQTFLLPQRLTSGGAGSELHGEIMIAQLPETHRMYSVVLSVANLGSTDTATSLEYVIE